MAGIITDSYNINSLNVPGVYVHVVPPPGTIQGAPSNVCAIVGTASWGLPNTPIACSTVEDIISNFGGVTQDAIGDVHDLCTEMIIALRQGQGSAGVTVIGVRAVHGTPIKSSVNLKDVSDIHGKETVTAGGTVTALETVSLTIQSSSIQGGSASLSYKVSGAETATVGGTVTEGETVSVTVQSASLPGGSASVPYTVLEGDDEEAVAEGLRDGINGNATLQFAGVTATAATGVVTIHYPGSMELVTFSRVNGENTTVTLAAAVTGDTTSTVATALKNAVNAHPLLQAVNITATVDTAVVTVDYPGNLNTVTFSRVNGANTTLTLASTQEPGASKNGITLTAKCPGKKGDEISIAITPGVKTDSFNVAIIPFSGAQIESYPNIIGGSAGAFWGNLLYAINNGITGLRPPSSLVEASNVDVTALDPATGTSTLSGGTDGRAVTTADLLGADGYSPTGIYAIGNVKPVPKLLWVAGLIDRAADVVIQSFLQGKAICAALTCPFGQSTDDAIAAKKASGIDDWRMFYCKDHVQWYDAYNGLFRYVSPTPFIGGRIAALSPEESPTNKSVYEVDCTIRLNKQKGEIPYGDAEIGKLHDNGIMIIANPTIGADRWAMPHGNNTCSDAVRAPIEYGTMTLWLAQTLQKAVRKFVGQNQSTRVNDPLRALIKQEVDSFLTDLTNAYQLDTFLTKCNKSNNPDSMVARHYLKLQVYARYMASVQYLIVELMGGTTVVTVETNVVTTSETT